MEKEIDKLCCVVQVVKVQGFMVEEDDEVIYLQLQFFVVVSQYMYICNLFLMGFDEVVLFLFYFKRGGFYMIFCIVCEFDDF